ncbi:MAG: hypothetical protein ACO3DD_06120, partial [Burkholderiaceae bacterium]
VGLGQFDLNVGDAADRQQGLADLGGDALPLPASRTGSRACSRASDPETVPAGAPAAWSGVAIRWLHAATELDPSGVGGAGGRGEEGAPAHSLCQPSYGGAAADS